jgi:MFS family permease
MEGFRLFHRQPLIWFLTLFAYWAGLVILAMIPLVGLIAPLILTPGLGFGFVALAFAIDRKEMPMPLLLVSGFRSDKAKPLLQMGLLYFVGLAVVLGLAWMVDGGSLFRAMSQSPEELTDPTISMDPSLQWGLIVAVLGYLPVLMAFWFAPQLLVWGQYPVAKALFYSFFAVWRNKSAFFVYGFCWFALFIFLSLLVAAFTSLVGLSPQAVFTLLMPITFILIAVAHGSFYASTRDIFATFTDPKEPSLRLVPTGEAAQDSDPMEPTEDPVSPSNPEKKD